VVHRALRALRQGGDHGHIREALPEMGRHLSEMERRADEAERELTEWEEGPLHGGQAGRCVRRVHHGVHAFGLFVELDEIYVQGLVHVSSMTDDYYVFNEKAHA